MKKKGNIPFSSLLLLVMLFLITLSDREEKKYNRNSGKRSEMRMNKGYCIHTCIKIQCITEKENQVVNFESLCNKEKTFYDNNNILKPDEPKDKWTPK